MEGMNLNPATADNERLLTVSDVAREFRRTTETIRKWERSGKLRAAMRLTGGTRLFRPEEVEKLKAELGAATGAAA